MPNPTHRGTYDARHDTATLRLIAGLLLAAAFAALMLTGCGSPNPEPVADFTDAEYVLIDSTAGDPLTDGMSDERVVALGRTVCDAVDERGARAVAIDLQTEYGTDQGALFLGSAVGALCPEHATSLSSIGPTS